MLCRSTTWLEKFSRHNAAVRLARTQFKYGRRVLDYNMKLVSRTLRRGKVKTHTISRPSGIKTDHLLLLCLQEKALAVQKLGDQTANHSSRISKPGFQMKAN